MNQIGDIIFKGSQYAIRLAGQHAIVCGFNGEVVTAQEIGWDGASVVKSDSDGDTYDAALVDESTPGADFGAGRNEPAPLPLVGNPGASERAVDGIHPSWL